MFSFILNFFKPKLKLKPKPIKNFSFTVQVLPNFPSFKIYEEEVWKHLNENKTLQKVCKDLLPSTQINKLFTCTYTLQRKFDLEGYPAYSPLTFNITLKETT